MGRLVHAEKWLWRHRRNTRHTETNTAAITMDEIMFTKGHVSGQIGLLRPGGLGGG